MGKKLSNLSFEILESILEVGKITVQWMVDRKGLAIYGPGGRSKYNFSYNFNNLERSGYIKSKKTNKKKYYYLTSRGKQESLKQLLKKKIKNKKWNGKWYILIFDIPEKKKGYRQKLRNILREIGFHQLQKSVWIFPFDIINYLYEVMPGFREGDWFEYLEVNRVSSQAKLKKKFGLK